jgi:predicted tellurium resistance membrane protein TerC
VGFISSLVSQSARKEALRARQTGRSLAFVFRVLTRHGLSWLMKLTYSSFSMCGFGIS